MAVLTPLEIAESYVDLLIMQYQSKTKARASVSSLVSAALMPQVSLETVVFSGIAASGAFVLSYDGNDTSSLLWDASASDIATALNALTGLGSVTVTGAIASQTLTVTFTGVTPPALLLAVVSNSLEDSSSATLEITIAQSDVTLPLAVSTAFNFLPGTTLASGVQLDILGKFAGVSRSGLSFTGGSPISLVDSDFVSLIKMAILRNGATSSLSSMQAFVHDFFAGEIYIFDHCDMSMTYVISTSVGSTDLIELFLSENLLPAPMGVNIFQVYFVPSTNLFSYRTYDIANTLGSPFNSYSDYIETWPWLSYQDIVST